MDDAPPAAAATRTGAGLALGLGSALTFGLSGPIAAGLLAAGWSASGAVLLRIGLAALVLLPFGLQALNGDWARLRRNWRLLALYGLLGVAAAQFCYFSAIARMDVGPALMIEYAAPSAIVGWLWLTHGQRPSRLTLGGMTLAATGLLLVLDIFSGARVNLGGALWALGAMAGAAGFFLVAGRVEDALPPITLAAGGLSLAGAGLGGLALVGILPVRASTADATYADHALPWWLAMTALAVIATSTPYVLGTAAARVLGSRLASFVGLLEVVATVAFAWVLLGQLPSGIQILGGALILAGVVAVRLGEPTVAVSDAELDLP